jgi:hypothetical protein
MDLSQIGEALEDLEGQTPGWRALRPEERARTIVNRGVDWLEQYADQMAAPLVFGDPSTRDASAERLFGGVVTTLSEALCATYRLLERNPTGARVAVLALTGVMFAATGLYAVGSPSPSISAQLVHHLPTLAPHVTEAIVVEFARRHCHHN